MTNPEPPPRVISFRVQVGHTAVTVNGDSRESAIAAARTKLCDQLPRLWDVIHHLDSARFEVSTVPSDPAAGAPLPCEPQPEAAESTPTLPVG